MNRLLTALLTAITVGASFSAQALEPIILDEAQLPAPVFCRISAEQYARAASDYRRDIPLHVTESPDRFDHISTDIFSSQYGILYDNYDRIADQVYENGGFEGLTILELINAVETSCLKEIS